MAATERVTVGEGRRFWREFGMTRHRLVAAVVALFLVVAQVATVAAAPRQGNAGDRAGFSATPSTRISSATSRRVRRRRSSSSSTRRRTWHRPRRSRTRFKRGDAVVKALKATAATSQKTARATVAKTKSVKATSYWLVNLLVVEGDAKTLDKVAKQTREAPRRHQHPRTEDLLRFVKPVETKVAILAAAGDPEWGVEKIRADEAWVDGVLGQGIVVANVDTGVDFTHPALDRALPRQPRRRRLRPQLQLVGPDRHLRRRAVRQRRPRHAHDGHDGRRRWPRAIHARHRRRTGRPVDGGQGLRGLRLQRHRAPVRGPVHPGADRPQRARTPTAPSAPTS